MTLIYLIPDCKCVMVKVQEERNSLLSYDYGPFISCLGIAANKGHQER